ncbi:tRNA pseudouridine(55) synthase TruB [Georgenia halophila]|uniref:tRNA pseudouridine synthase B n=1 Tax=Georgenia halophila TaxID=620889 RepID=A0ABP8L764_9MICO
MIDIPRGAVTAADGLVVVDKPQGWTSHDVVARTRRLAATKKVGHAGTLDPLATGVLVLGVGRATRMLTYLVGSDKEYRATVRLGQRTVTDDAEGEISAAPGAAALLTEDGSVDVATVEEALAPLRGPIRQVPSSVSAIKVGGRRSYARVRAGEDVALESRPVTVHRLETVGAPVVHDLDGTTVVDVDVLVACSSGTYVRALARDLGESLRSGGHLTALRRSRVGPFGLDDARTIEELAAAVAADAATEGPRGLPVTTLTSAARAAFPARGLDEAETAAVRVGKPLSPSGYAAGVTAAFAPDGHVVALLGDDRGRARPVVVLDPA